MPTAHVGEGKVLDLWCLWALGLIRGDIACRHTDPYHPRYGHASVLCKKPAGDSAGMKDQTFSLSRRSTRTWTG